MMDPQMLVDQAMAAPLPAPVWFVQFFKWLGFTLHAVPMNLWYAGMLTALCLHLLGNEHARRFAGRLLQQMPVIVALGVNFGVVPLLFVQLAYYKAFYPATILMAWFWLAIVALLIPAYYGVYAYAWGIRSGSKKGTVTFCAEHPRGHSGKRGLSPFPAMAGWRIAAGWCAAVFFICIGFLFANGLSLMDHWGRWVELWKQTSTAGAALGTALNVGDPTLWPRWLLMFGLALGTTAVWLLIDAFWLAAPTADDGYCQWALRFGRKLYTLALIWTAAAGAWYVFGTWSTDLRAEMFGWPLLPLTVATAMAPGLPWLVMFLADRFPSRRVAVAAIAICQFGVLGINAASRQIVQNVNLRLFLSILSQPLDVQWGPLVLFLVVFVTGLVVIGWMIAQVCRSSATSGPNR
jgi:hypothetical protein